MTKWAKILKDHTVVTKKSKAGVHRGEKDFKASEEPVPVTQAQLEALLEANAAEEVPAPEGKGTTKSGTATDRPTASAPPSGSDGGKK